MKLFNCPACGGNVFFDNLRCGCGAALMYEPDARQFAADAGPCANRQVIGCNWVSAKQGGLCRACAMTRVIPDTFHGQNRNRFADAEKAKRWVLDNLAGWGWLTSSDTGIAPVFDLLAEDTSGGPVEVTMGHAKGVVTINVTEADPAEQVARRERLGERFRTMIGHFRHELGHFFFDRLAKNDAFVQEFRALFGDERADYAAALKLYYAKDSSDYPSSEYITEYATSHPHEDWAESFAHTLHLVDMADSAAAAGLARSGIPVPGYDAYTERDAQRIIELGADLGIALNHVNRSMGLEDLYPFVLSDPVWRKLAFVHSWMSRAT